MKNSVRDGGRWESTYNNAMMSYYFSTITLFFI